MATITPNNADLDLFDRLATGNEIQNTVKSSDAEGSFITKCTHPPSAVPGYAGLPTLDSRSQVNIEWRGIRSMATTLEQTTTAIQEVFSPKTVAFLIPSGARVNYVTWASLEDGTLVQDLGNVGLNDQYDFSNWRSDANVYRPAYRSTTFYLNKTAFEDTGFCSAYQFNPSLMFNGSVLTYAESSPRDFLAYVKEGINVGLFRVVKPSDKDYETHINNFHAFPIHIRAELRLRLNVPESHIINLDPDFPIQFINVGNLPLVGQGTSAVPSAQVIMQSSSRSYAGKAKDGLFVVQRLNTIAPTWMSATNTSLPTGDNPGGLYQCNIVSYNTAGVKNVQILSDNRVVGATLAFKPLFDTMWTKDMTWTWARFDGLQYSNYGGSGGNSAVITKTYAGFEIQPAGRSGWNGMAMSSPKPSVRTMEAMMDVFYTMKDAMPARYNFMGVVPMIKAALPILAEVGAPLVKSVVEAATSAAEGSGEVEGEKSTATAVKEMKEEAKIVEKVAEKTGAPPALMSIKTKPPSTNKRRTGRRSRSASRTRSLSRQMSSLRRSISQLSVASGHSRRRRKNRSNRRKRVVIK